VHVGLIATSGGEAHQQPDSAGRTVHLIDW
jgi:hypothetical protein